MVTAYRECEKAVTILSLLNRLTFLSDCAIIRVWKQRETKRDGSEGESEISTGRGWRHSLEANEGAGHIVSASVKNSPKNTHPKTLANNKEIGLNAKSLNNSSTSARKRLHYNGNFNASSKVGCNSLSKAKKEQTHGCARIYFPGYNHHER